VDRTYSVRTWDAERQEWTPHPGLEGPYTLWELRGVIRTLRESGYGHDRRDMHCALIERERAPR
jgi:hypothetical protein